LKQIKLGLENTRIADALYMNQSESVEGLERFV